MPKNKTRSRQKNTIVTVAVSQNSADNKYQLLESNLLAAGFWEVIDTARKKSKTPAAEFRVVIKPDLHFFDTDSSTGTDPRLVEHLIDLLAQKGYRNVSVVSGKDSAESWLENRDVLILADLAGYKFVTPGGHRYNIIDLSEDVRDAGFAAESALRNSELSAVWLDAQFRISFAKNKSDEEFRFALGLQNLIGVLPLRDKEYHYRNRLQSGEVCADLLARTPIHFAIIDAFISNHGSAGSREVNPIETRTCISSADILLADWAAALKMGLDPYASNINSHVLRKSGLPKKYEIKGDLSPYPGWKNVTLMLADSVSKRNEYALIQRMSRPWLQQVNREVFPFKNVVDDQINSFLTNFLRDMDEHPLSFWVNIGLNYFLGNIAGALDAWHILYEKDRLYRREVALAIELEKYSREDYKAVIDYMSPLAEIARQTPPDQNGLKWRYIDNSVLFEFSRILPIPYAEFISRVDISQAVQMMFDNIGGARKVVDTDASGRVITQAERDMYLPQPNWMVLFGGQIIDVGKLEIIRYERNRQRIFWRTVTSENKSAEFDDGIVTFAKHKAGVEITIVARQKFTLPLIWQMINLDLYPQIKDVLVSNAYISFFSRTMANYEAAYEGRDPRIGRDRVEKDDDAAGGAFFIAEQLKEVFTVFSGVIEKIGVAPGKSAANNDPGTLDENGFRHFISKDGEENPLREKAGEFLNDLSSAFKKDVAYMRDNPEQNDK